MGMETRIGIATGLLIVVMASVYFFYSRDRSDQDLLIASASQAEAPIVPVSPDRKEDISRQSKRDKTSSSSPSGKGTKARPPSIKKNYRTKPPRTNERVASKGAESRAYANQRSRTRLKPVPLKQSPKRRQTQTRGVPPSRQSKPTQLRAKPSSSLIEATQDNLQPKTGETPPKTASVVSNRPANTKPETGSSMPTGRAKRPARHQHSQAASAREFKTKSPAPAEVWPKRHKIGQNDTLSDISKRYYSTSRLVGQILKANPKIKNPRRLKIGDIIIIPPPNSTTRSSGVNGAVAANSGKRIPTDAAVSSATYRVRKGDTFYSIAQKMLGSSARWREVYECNRDVVKNDPKRLKPGMMLTMPG